MSDGYEVSFSAMSAGHQAFLRQYRNMTDTLSQLESDLEAKLGRWEDQAREAYREAKREWDQSAEVVKDKVEDFGRHVQLAGERYSGTEGEVAKSWV